MNLKIISVLTLTVLTLEVYGQSLRTIHGKIISAEGKSPLPGVNVIERGTKNGTVSDSNGEFQLNVNRDSTVYLVLMFIDLNIYSKYNKTDVSKIFELSLDESRESQRINKEWIRLQKRKKRLRK